LTLSWHISVTVQPNRLRYVAAHREGWEGVRFSV
jgi:hypothetical protein